MSTPRPFEDLVRNGRRFRRRRPIWRTTSEQRFSTVISESSRGHRLPANSVGMDVGCGSGRWAVLAAPRVGHLHLVDPSEEAISVAKANLAGIPNVSFHVTSVADLPAEDQSLDFAYAIGVLHHVPDTQRAIACIARKLKPGAPFLIYLYYAFDNRPAWYRWLWRLSNALRLVLSRVSAPVPLRGQPSDRGRRVLAARAHRSVAGCDRNVAALDPFIVLQGPFILRDANGCLRSVLHTVGKKIHQRGNKGHARGSRI